MPLQVQIVAPEEELFAGPADFVLARTVEGEIGILPGHAPLLAQLVAFEVKVRSGASESLYPIAGGGFITVKDDKVIILAEAKQAR